MVLITASELDIIQIDVNYHVSPASAVESNAQYVGLSPIYGRPECVHVHGWHVVDGVDVVIELQVTQCSGTIRYHSIDDHPFAISVTGLGILQLDAHYIQRSVNCVQRSYGRTQVQGFASSSDEISIGEIVAVALHFSLKY